MSRRKIWNRQEDAVLKILREERGLKKWSEISKAMSKQFGITQRSGKQCRERYHSHLDSSVSHRQWSREEEIILYSLHGELGNKWSAISHQLPGRSDNCVKNHFYSKLRKSVRRLNRVIQQSRREEWRQIKQALLNKVIQATEQRFKMNSRFEQEIVDQCSEIVKRLFCFEQMIQESSHGRQNVSKLINKVMEVEFKLRKSLKYWRGKKDQGQTTPESKNSQKRAKAQVKTQEGDQPYYEIFRKVCESIMLNNN